MLEKAIETTRPGPYTHVNSQRLADDMEILINSHPSGIGCCGRSKNDCAEELARLRVESRKRSRERGR